MESIICSDCPLFFKNPSKRDEEEEEMKRERKGVGKRVKSRRERKVKNDTQEKDGR